MRKNKITYFTLIEVFLRSFLIQAVWNYQSMQSIGFCFALSPVGKKLFSTVKKRKDLDPALRALLGQTKDPRANIVTSISKVAEFIEKDQFIKNALELGEGKYFYVAHLMKDRIPVKIGQTVEAGTLLGYIGNSGNTFFPHLHIHVQNNPKAVMEGRITYPFRFKKMKRKRLIFWRKVRNGDLIRNDRFYE